MLQIRDVHKSYGAVHALSGVDLDVDRGEIVALLGPNGAGKTTLVSIVAGLRRADSGKVWIDGTDVTQRPFDSRGHLGLAPQETGIYPTVSVKDNLRFFGELAGLRGRRLHERIDAAAAAFSLSELLNRKAQTLSGGEARRLHTAMVILNEPPLLLLDEPTAGVDVGTRNQLLELIRSLAGVGTAVVYSTHYLQEVEQLNASKLAILANGRIAASGSMRDLIGIHSGSFVELHFHGEPPDLPGSPDVLRIGREAVRVPVEDPPALAAAALLRDLDGASGNLREIKLLQPNLESVFLAVTAETAGEQEGST
jgi:ABC-2 type transport system ATP-binding protein